MILDAFMKTEESRIDFYMDVPPLSATGNSTVLNKSAASPRRKRISSGRYVCVWVRGSVQVPIKGWVGANFLVDL